MNTIAGNIKSAAGRSIILLSLISFILIPSVVRSDTVILKDGTFLVGKVKVEESESIVFKNSYGAFTIKRAEITSLYITKSYREDIAIRRKLGRDFNEAEIRNNYAAGQMELTEKERTLVVEQKSEGTDSAWRGRIFSEAAGLVSMGELNDPIPYGFMIMFGLETGCDYRCRKNINFMIPWFRAEAGYLRFSKGEASLAGFTGGAGPLWIFPVSADYHHNIRVALEPGFSVLGIENGDERASTFTFTFHGMAGYEYSFDSVALFVNIRYVYVYDRDVLFHSTGISAGISSKLWQL